MDQPLDVLLDDSAGFRLSKLVTTHPLAGISDLHLDFIRPKYDAFNKDDITACLHITEEDIALVPQWLEAWNGIRTCHLVSSSHSLTRHSLE